MSFVKFSFELYLDFPSFLCAFLIGIFLAYVLVQFPSKCFCNLSAVKSLQFPKYGFPIPIKILVVSNLATAHQFKKKIYKRNLTKPFPRARLSLLKSRIRQVLLLKCSTVFTWTWIHQPSALRACNDITKGNNQMQECFQLA